MSAYGKVASPVLQLGLTSGIVGQGSGEDVTTWSDFGGYRSEEIPHSLGIVSLRKGRLYEIFLQVSCASFSLANGSAIFDIVKASDNSLILAQRSIVARPVTGTSQSQSNEFQQFYYAATENIDIKVRVTGGSGTWNLSGFTTLFRVRDAGSI